MDIISKPNLFQKLKNKKKYWLFKNWVLILLKDGPIFKIDFKKMPDFWIFYFGRFILSNDIVNLNKEWNNI